MGNEVQGSLTLFSQDDEAAIGAGQSTNIDVDPEL